MPKHRNAAASGPAAGAGAPPPLPDLRGVGLRGLRVLRDPGLAAAVDSTLRRPAELDETWYSSGHQGGRLREPAEAAGAGA
ncbi:hypothetical protein [Streptomyces huiliensis]|uniref:hypothetical protein n=1 Tax=Streptomyces huiliensis TaxID=2876027 RepID=UPI001CBE1C5B|nr:hypothetical protein [Streptomyces huiliensis]MBZ4322740.1 hypothetical protein [Streptomyces huiliensis]